jgi:hypothetical protein
MRMIESALNSDDKTFIKKILLLEKSLEKVNELYHQVITQKSVIKVENQVNIY